jgi:hypothetical protein
MQGNKKGTECFLLKNSFFCFHFQIKILNSNERELCVWARDEGRGGSLISASSYRLLVLLWRREGCCELGMMNSTKGKSRGNLMRTSVVVMKSTSNGYHERYFTYVACQGLPVYFGSCLGDLSVLYHWEPDLGSRREPVRFSIFKNKKHRRWFSWLILMHLRTRMRFSIRFSHVQVSTGSHLENWTKNQFKNHPTLEKTGFSSFYTCSKGVGLKT